MSAEVTASRPRGFPTGATLVRALAAARWLTWLWMLFVVIAAVTVEVDNPLTRDPTGPATALRQPVVAWFCVGAVFAMCVIATLAVRSEPRRAMSPKFAAAEIVLAVGLSAVDGWVFDPGHVFETSQSLATQYPLIALATSGLAFGPWVAALLGALVGPAEAWAAELNLFGPWQLRHVASIVATSIFFACAGALFGWFGRLLRDVEGRIADQRARDDIALVLHDTVLQTLALVEHRTADGDPELALAARTADRDLRRFLFGAAALPADDLEAQVRLAVERSSRDHDINVTVNVVDPGGSTDTAGRSAVAGAIGEAVTNAVKHAHASSIVVFVETEEDGKIFASVRDDGVGFDPETARRGMGLDRSISGRLHTAGGRSEIRSAPGTGTDVRMWSR